MYELPMEGDARDVMLDVLCSLTQSGFFRKYGTRLMQVSNRGIEFFIPSDEMQPAETAISVAFLNTLDVKRMHNAVLKTVFMLKDGNPEYTKSLIAREDLSRIHQIV